MVQAAALPIEIRDQVLLNYFDPTAQLRSARTTALTRTGAMRPPYYSPPEDGACPFMELSTELRRAIFAESLVAKDKLIQPKCADEADFSSRIDSEWPKRNQTSSLMTLNKAIRDEIAEVVYEESTFVIHVHEGLLDGGIEFIDAGRQPLHFQDCTSDHRFWKFRDSEKDFGFRRLKKICIQIYPTPEENTRHCAINTFFTNLALVRLLERSGEEEHRVTSFTIQFMDPKRTGHEQGRRAILRAEQYWWDPEKNQPRETSIHDVPDIEIVLRPFANLTGCHTVNIEMPSQLANYARIAVFVRDLKASMASRHGLGFADDDLDRKIEAGRYAMEDYTYSLKHGVKHHEVKGLTEDDMQDNMDVDDSDHDSSIDQPRKRQKKSMFRMSAPSLGDVSLIEDEEEDLARAMQESTRFAPGPMDAEDEMVQMKQALMASLADLDELQELDHVSSPDTQASSSTGAQAAAQTWAQVAAQNWASGTSSLSDGHVGAQQNGDRAENPSSAATSFAALIPMLQAGPSQSAIPSTNSPDSAAAHSRGRDGA